MANALRSESVRHWMGAGETTAECRVSQGAIATYGGMGGALNGHPPDGPVVT
jgi:hypothetical protein